VIRANCWQESMAGTQSGHVSNSPYWTNSRLNSGFDSSVPLTLSKMLEEG
jgi:hypothetical protein